MGKERWVGKRRPGLSSGLFRYGNETNKSGKLQYRNQSTLEYKSYNNCESSRRNLRFYGRRTFIIVSQFKFSLFLRIVQGWFEGSLPLCRKKKKKQTVKQEFSYFQMENKF